MTDHAQIIREALEHGQFICLKKERGRYDEALAALDALEAELARKTEALRDFAQLLPPDRWRLLHPESKETLGEIQRAALGEDE